MTSDQPNGELGLESELHLYLAPRTDVNTTVTEEQPMLSAGGNSNAILDCWVSHRRCVSHRLLPALRCMQFFGYFPCGARGLHSTGSQSASGLYPRRRNRHGNRIVDAIFQTYGLALILLNLYISRINLTVTVDYKTHFGMLHAFTITSIITGLKPMINAANIFVFNVCKQRHKHLLRVLDRVEAEFAKGFGLEPNMVKYNIAIICSCVGVGLFFFGVRVTEFVVSEDEFGRSLLVDLSLVLVPLISVWGTIPLFYFILVESLVLYWCENLRSRLLPAQGQRQHQLKYYYRKFLLITELQEAAGDLFGPWLLVSMGWSVFSLCLTIYFATQAHSFLELPAVVVATAEDPAALWSAHLILYFNVVWSCLQIFIAMVYICVICYLGTTVNEQSRLIMKSVLEGVNDSEMESERFLVTCFMYKMQTQYVWGVTVWRAFPVERSVFFTMVSLIVTYAVLLMKFRDSDDPLAGYGVPPGNGTSNASLWLTAPNATLTDLANVFLNVSIF